MNYSTGMQWAWPRDVVHSLLHRRAMQHIFTSSECPLWQGQEILVYLYEDVEQERGITPFYLSRIVFYATLC